jgi:hypothetical protein
MLTLMRSISRTMSRSASAAGENSSCATDRRDKTAATQNFMFTSACNGSRGVSSAASSRSRGAPRKRSRRPRRAALVDSASAQSMAGWVGAPDGYGSNMIADRISSNGCSNVRWGTFPFRRTAG